LEASLDNSRIRDPVLVLVHDDGGTTPGSRIVVRGRSIPPADGTLVAAHIAQSRRLD
jgi:hypothetical protein